MGESLREPSIVSVEPRMRRPSSIAEASLRGRIVSVVAVEKDTLSRRQSHAAFLSMAPGFTEYVVEHVVLFKVKDDADPAKKKAMLFALHELRSLDGVLELTVGSALSVQGGKYTHVLHGRYKDKAALKAYLVHPDHVKIQQTHIQPLTEDIIALDWECIPCGPYIKSVGAKRITFVKVKPETTSDDMRFLVESISQLPSKCPTVGQASAGSNFSPERAKGFTYGIMEFFPSTQEEEEVFCSCEHIAWQETKLKPVAAILIHADLHVGE